MSPRDDVLVGVEELASLVGTLPGEPDRTATSDVRPVRPGHPVLLDVRWALGRDDGFDRYLEAHVPGAVYVDLETELAAPASRAGGRHPLPSADALQEAARRWGVRATTPVVVYDGVGGMSAARAWWLLRWAGHADVRILDGGIDAWERAGLPTERHDVTPERGDVVVRPGAVAVLDADGAAQVAASGTLLDARAGERYRGEVEPVDLRAGHVPGALSAPTAGNLADDGTFLPDDALRARFATLGVVGPDGTGPDGTGPDGTGPDGTRRGAVGPVGVYCGSGVTAAHEAAALAVLGLEVALYAGSWSQWSGDPGRPVATGA